MAGLSVFLLLFASGQVGAKTVRYELHVDRAVVNLSGRTSVDWALAVNGSIPAPTLEFEEGDDAEIVVSNKLADEEVSIHWHGLLLPPEMDGVPYVNTPPMRPGKSYTYKFRIRQHGTYWYHSHTAAQEQKGVYGAFVIHPKKKPIAYDRDFVAVLSDWADERPENILKNLRKDGDYYLYKKGTVRSWLGAWQAGALGTYLHNEWSRMGGMDASDVGYDAFLINGKRGAQLLSARPGEKIRLRLINAAASTYFYVALGAEPMRVISADGIDVQPVRARELFMGMAETYDVLMEIPPEGGNFELRASAMDGTGAATGWIGSGRKIAAPSRAPPDLYAPMAHEGHTGHGGSHHATGHVHHAVETLTVDALRALTPSSGAAPKYELKLVLGGDMERYVWHINGKTIKQDRLIELRHGDVVRFTLVNSTMMNHPIHLHGHFFRVLNEGKSLSPLKHTVDVPPHSERVIEFVADEPGQWMLHCHNLYHMKMGMARVVGYAGYVPPPEVEEAADPHGHDHIYYAGMAETSTNHLQLRLRAERTADTLDLRFENRSYRDLHEAEADLLYRYWVSNYLNFVVGLGQNNAFMKHKTSALAGVGYKLPLLVEAGLFLDSFGRARLDLEKRFQWSKYIYTDAEVSFRQGMKTEFEVSLMFANSWSWSAGLMFIEDGAGVGAELRF